MDSRFTFTLLQFNHKALRIPDLLPSLSLTFSLFLKSNFIYVPIYCTIAALHTTAFLTFWFGGDSETFIQAIFTSIISLYYRSIIALQCWIHFCCTAKWISYVHAYVSSLLSDHHQHLTQLVTLSYWKHLSTRLPGCSFSVLLLCSCFFSVFSAVSLSSPNLITLECLPDLPLVLFFSALFSPNTPP